MALAQAELRFWHGRDEDPLPAAERALEINPIWPKRIASRSGLEQQGRQEEADEELQEALRLGPESWEVNREAARLMFRRDRMSDAIRFFEKPSQLMDTDFHSCLMLQTCYRDGRRAGCTGVAGEPWNAPKWPFRRTRRTAPALAAGASSLIMIGEVDRARTGLQRAFLLEPEISWSATMSPAA